MQALVTRGVGVGRGHACDGEFTEAAEAVGGGVAQVVAADNVGAGTHVNGRAGAGCIDGGLHAGDVTVEGLYAVAGGVELRALLSGEVAGFAGCCRRCNGGHFGGGGFALLTQCVELAHGAQDTKGQQCVADVEGGQVVEYGADVCRRCERRPGAYGCKHQQRGEGDGCQGKERLFHLDMS